jgi:hypothetical protein
MVARKVGVDPRQAALEALASSLGDSDPKILYGSKAAPGFFTGSGAATKSAAEACIAEGWLEDTGTKNGTARSAKSLFRLTAKGRKAILDNNPTKKLLESLDQVAKDQLGEIQGIALVLKALSAKVETFGGAVQNVLEKVHHSADSTVHNKSTANGNVNGPTPLEEVEVELIARARQHTINNPLALPELYKTLKTLSSRLTLGEFHDCVRRLWKEGRIKLGPYTRSYGVIASDYEAMFLDGQVMYYAFAS